MCVEKENEPLEKKGEMEGNEEKRNKERKIMNSKGIEERNYER